MSGLLRHSVRRLLPTMTSNVTSKATVISGPPKNPLSAVDKYGLGGGMCVAIVLPMLWIIANIEYYKNPGGSQ